MRKLKFICQLLIAFIIASLGYNIFYEPHQETVRAAVRQQFAQAGGAGQEAPGQLKITMLDVGHGDAILLSTAGRNVMIDTGDSRNLAQLEAGLARAQVKRVHTVFVTHHHEDHMGNTLKVAGKYGVSRIYDSGYPNARNANSVRLNQVLRAGNYNNRALRAGDTVYLGKNYYVEVLSPDASLSRELAANLNNTSLVMLLHYGSFTMLFMGDAEKEIEGLLAEKYGARLKADILKVGHHGSRTSSIYRLTSRVKPAYALISCGPFELYHHPNKNVVGSLKHLGARVLTTADNGSITVLTDGKSFSVETEK